MRLISFIALTGAAAATTLLAQKVKKSKAKKRADAPRDALFMSQPEQADAQGQTGVKNAPQDPVGRANPEMQKILRVLKSLGGKPIERLTTIEARLQPTPADAVEALLRDQGKNPAHLKAEMGVAVQNTQYPGVEKSLPARLYIPGDRVDGIRPVIVYYHGGGFVIADLDTYDAAPRALAKKTGAIVVSVDYRRAPEHKFPAAHEDAFAAYQWVIANAVQWGGDPTRVAVAGESAGGNLAANVAIMARDKGILAPAHMVLVYPLAGNDLMTLSYQENAKAVPLNKPMMEWFIRHTLRNPADRQNPMINLVAADLSGLPSATVITAEIDPLRTEGRLLAERLKLAGSKVSYRNFEGVTHEFFGMDAVLADAVAAQDMAAQSLTESFKGRFMPMKQAANAH